MIWRLCTAQFLENQENVMRCGSYFHLKGITKYIVPMMKISTVIIMLGRKYTSS